MVMRACVVIVRRLFILYVVIAQSAYASIVMKDGLGQDAIFAQSPQRIVSLSPAASEILSALDAGDRVVGVSISDGRFAGLESKAIIGPFTQPAHERILALKPDLVILSSAHGELAHWLAAQGVQTLTLEARSLAEMRATIHSLSALVGQTERGNVLIAREHGYQKLVAGKLARLSAYRPWRTMRIVSVIGDKLLVPADDSLSNALIQQAGAQPPKFNAVGEDILITPEQWRAFNPQAVYFASSDVKIRGMLSKPEWREVDAVKQGRLFGFPSELLKTATHYGYFSLWLASELNGEAFSQSAYQVTPDRILSEKALRVPFSYVASAQVVESQLFDFPAKTLIVRFNQPQSIVSSLDGWREGISAVGNHYSSPPSWSITHYLGLEQSNLRVLASLGLTQKTGSFLYTGADMQNVAFAEAESDGLRVGVLATAGVLGNAMRASVDSGNYVEPGTVNLIIVTNRQLTPAAMTRAVITATEAKTAALEDLDIRSSYSHAAATGTGTDNIIVVQGEGAKAALTGGHTKLGELIARAVHQAVIEAIWKQNRLTPSRSIFQRLAERKIDLKNALSQSRFLSDDEQRDRLAASLEQLLLNKHYADYLAMAFAISDSQQRGLVSDTQAFTAMSLTLAGTVAQRPVAVLLPIFDDRDTPPLIRESLNALATGLYFKQNPPILK